MPDLTDLEHLVTWWRGYVADHPADDEFSRQAGYLAGLTVCADHLAETLERMRANA